MLLCISAQPLPAQDSLILDSLENIARFFAVDIALCANKSDDALIWIGITTHKRFSDQKLIEYYQLRFSEMLAEYSTDAMASKAQNGGVQFLGRQLTAKNCSEIEEARASMMRNLTR